MQPFQLFLCFESWDPRLDRFAPVPDGTRVRLFDANRVLADELLAEAWTDQGRVRLPVPATRDEARPDLYLALLLPSERPAWLPLTWDSRQSIAVDGTPGDLPDHGGPGLAGLDLGSPALPLCFRLSFDLFLSFVRFDPEQGRWRGVAAGLQVSVLQGQGPAAMVLATAPTDGQGRVHLMLLQTPGPGADLWLRARGPGVDWDSRHAFHLDEPDAPGFFEDLAASGLGSPEQPLVFDLSDGSPRVFPGNRVQPLIDGVALLPALEQVLARAQHTVHIEMMLFFDDPAGRRMADALVACAERGVRVRLLVDVATTRSIHLLVHAERFWARFLRDLPQDRRQRMLERYDALAPEEAARGQVDGLLDRLRRTPGITVLDSSFGRVELDPSLPEDVPAAYRKLEEALPLLTLARVDHRKIVVVDGQIALLGGQNFGEEYLYEEPYDPERPAEEEPWHKWHDVFVQVEGPVVGEVQRLFRERWFAELGQEASAMVEPEARAFPGGGEARPGCFPTRLPRPDGLRCRLLRTTPGASHELERVLLDRLARAERRVLAATPYFSSPEALRALCQAARRGLQVVLVLPDQHNDSVDFHYAARLVYDELLAAGVELYEYQHRMNHSKCLVIDDSTLIGSANLNRSSFRAHYEVALLVEDADFSERFAQALWGVDLPRSRRIRAEELPDLLDIVAPARWYLRSVVWTRF